MSDDFVKCFINVAIAAAGGGGISSSRGISPNVPLSSLFFFLSPGWRQKLRP